MGPAKALAAITENEWDAWLFRNRDSVAKTLGWTSYHTLRSKGSRSGFPDRTLFRDRVIFAELKTIKNKPTDEQVMWLDGLSRAGGEVYLWRPDDGDDVARVLGRRWRLDHILDAASGRMLPTLIHDGDRWTPGSIWVAGVGRAESLAPKPGQMALP